jgi:orotate phosphoribosyltransferase
VNLQDSTEKREKLKKLIEEHGIIFSDVTLSSNKKSSYYFDIKTIINHPDGVHLIGELMHEKVRTMDPKVRCVGGMEMGAIPLTTSILYFSNQLHEEYRLHGFTVRKAPKEHGLQKKIEGYLMTHLIVVEDVVTSGKSALDAVEALNAENITPSGIICVVDREDERNMLKAGNLKFESLFKHSEFADYIRTKLENKIT